MKRLYDGIAAGVLDPQEPDLKARLDDHIAKRDAAGEALERIGRVGSDCGNISNDQIARFSNAMSERLRSGDVVFQKGYLRTLISEIVVHKDRAEIVGRTDRLVQALGNERSDNSVDPNVVRACVPKWRTREDSNSRPPDS